MFFSLVNDERFSAPKNKEKRSKLLIILALSIWVGIWKLLVEILCASKDNEKDKIVDPDDSDEEWNYSNYTQ